MKIKSATTILVGMAVFLRVEVMAAPLDRTRDLIIDGVDASKGQFPSFAAGVGCGGTLIYEDIVLTAAHCNANGVFSFEDFVQIGGIKSPWLYDVVELDGEIIPTVCTVNHPKYVPLFTSKGYDIALVKLARPSGAPLMELNFDSADPSIKETVITMGYGIAGYEDPIPGDDTIPIDPEILQVLSPLFVQTTEACASYDENFSADFHLCTNDFNPYTTTCSGDSGGPLLTENGAQVGILSFGIYSDYGECLGDAPDYWTNVAKFEAFIKEGICALSYNPPDDCPTETDLSLLVTCLDPPTYPPIRAPTNAPTKAPKRSMKSKGVMSEGGMSVKSKKGMMNIKGKNSSPQVA